MNLKLSLSMLLFLAFIACSTQQEVIIVKQPFGLSNVEQLTFVGDNGEAYWGPKGEEIIFQSKRDGNACDKIYIMNADGSNQRMVSPDVGAHTCSYFSIDKERIIFASTFGVVDSCPPRPKPQGNKYLWSLFPYDIYSSKPDGTDLVRIRENAGYDAEPTVSYLTGKVIFTSEIDDDLELFTMNIDGSDVNRLTNHLGYDGGPYFSPDAQKIVWRAWYPETPEDTLRWQENMALNQVEAVPLDIYSMDADGKNIIRLTNNGATNWAPSWHPNGRQVVFSSNMDDWNDEVKAYGHNFELYMINLDGSGLVRLTNNTFFDSFPMFSPDGKSMAFASNRDAENPRATHIFKAEWND
ncbi:MAG: PD40 domain-containing protein [Candidatus Marinimicrobia bacterium]|nr:PD40 domain-containing protein [Candidatus Neomarinimicrobiota bacterium]